MVLFFLFAPLRSSPLGLLGGAPYPNSILHAFLGLTSSPSSFSKFSLSACCISSPTSPFKPTFCVFSLLFPPPPTFLCLSAVPFSFLPPALFPCSQLLCVTVGSDLQPLDFPHLSLSPSLGRLLHSDRAAVGLRGVMPGWGISLHTYLRLSFPYSPLPSFHPFSISFFPFASLSLL